MKKLWYSPTLRTAVVYGAAGLGFSAANLIMARVLPTSEYGVFTLVIALSNLGYALAPAGVDGIVQRRHLDAGPELLRRTMVASVGVGLAFTVVAGLAYSMTLPMLAILLISTIAGGLMMVAGSQFQSERRFGLSLTLTQSPNLVLLVAGLAVLALRSQSAWTARPATRSTRLGLWVSVSKNPNRRSL